MYIHIYISMYIYTSMYISMKTAGSSSQGGPHAATPAIKALLRLYEGSMKAL